MVRSLAADSSAGACRPAFRGRLAPSPTGALHLGNARSFLIAWLRVRAAGGRLVMRMEDLDHPKNKPGAAEQALADLRWLGLDWDEGPDVGGAYGPYTQSERIALYRQALDRLIALRRVYPCVCSRRDVEAAQSAPHAGEAGLSYAGICRGRFPDFDAAQAVLPPGRLPAWRFRAAAKPVCFTDGLCGVQVQDVAAESGDFVLARHAGGAGYMLAVVVDDAAMDISEVVRGDDLLPATGRQIQLMEALGIEPPAYLHVPLVVGADGRRLAKRHGDTRIDALRLRGIPPERVVGLLAWWCGWAVRGEALMPHDLIDRFDLSRLPPEAVVLTPSIERLLTHCS